MIRLRSKRPDPLPQEARVSLEIAGAPVEVRVRRSVRARRYGLRIANATGEVVLTVPHHGCYERAIAFLNDHEGWLAKRLAGHDRPVPFEPGAKVPLRGDPHVIVAAERRRGLIDIRHDADPPELVVPGDPDHLSRRLTDWLKRQAREDLTQAVTRHAAQANRKPGRISVRDTTSRWGSCSSRGGLSFSWRLILAPPFVLDYVAAHEVAHLVHMNHSPAFWALTRTLFPKTDAAEAWLKREGRGLYRYGRADR